MPEYLKAISSFTCYLYVDKACWYAWSCQSASHETWRGLIWLLLSSVWLWHCNNWIGIMGKVQEVKKPWETLQIIIVLFCMLWYRDIFHLCCNFVWNVKLWLLFIRASSTSNIIDWGKSINWCFSLALVLFFVCRVMSRAVPAAYW